MTAIVPLLLSLLPWTIPAENTPPRYHSILVQELLLPNRDLAGSMLHHFSTGQRQLLENLNRRSLQTLSPRDRTLLPHRWDLDLLAHAPFPKQLSQAQRIPKLLVVDLSIQAFGAYEEGKLVRWGAVCSGRKAMKTPTGAYHLIFRQRHRISNFNANWRMDWYFNFDNIEGNAFHAGTLYGKPVSHGCIRLVLQEAIWLYNWGDERMVEPRNGSAVRVGTPVIVQGKFDHTGSPAWLALDPHPRLPKAELRPPKTILDTLSSLPGHRQKTEAVPLSSYLQSIGAIPKATESAPYKRLGNQLSVPKKRFTLQ